MDRFKRFGSFFKNDRDCFKNDRDRFKNDGDRFKNDGDCFKNDGDRFKNDGDRLNDDEIIWSTIQLKSRSVDFSLRLFIGKHKGKLFTMIRVFTLNVCTHHL